MARLTPMSFGRGFYYYIVSLLAAFYLVFIHSASRQSRRIIKATISLLNPASYRRKDNAAALSPTSSKAAAAAEAQAARLIHARADAALGMPLYKHHRDLLPASLLTDGGARAGLALGGVSDDSAPWSIARCPVVHRSFRTRDGTLIRYHILYPGNPRTMVFANGLGAASDFSAFASVIHRYGKVGGDYSFLTWDYRGLFSGASLSPEASDGSSARSAASRTSAAGGRSNNSIKRPRRLAIPNHAEDLFEILEQERIRRIDLLIGWSMGVQISIEFAALYPDSVRRLALLNGTYGSVFETAFQPFFRVPFLAGAVASAVEYLVATPRALRMLVMALKPSLWIYTVLYRFFLEPEYLVALLGEGYFARFLDTYMGDVLSSPEHTENYLRLFQELNAHSTFHLLKEIPHRTLVISGLLDCLTPAYLSFEMSRKLPRARHVVAYLSSHCVLLEQPKLVIQEIAKLVESDDGSDDEADEAAVDSEEEAARTEQWQRGLNRAAQLSAKNGARAARKQLPKSNNGGFNPRHNSFAVPASATASASSSAAATAATLRAGVLRTSSDSLDRSRPEHSVARRRSAYFPSGSGSDSENLSEGEQLLELGVDDHAALEFEAEVASVAELQQQQQAEGSSMHRAAHQAASSLLSASNAGSQLVQEWSLEHQLAGESLLDPEAMPTEEELEAMHRAHVEAGSPEVAAVADAATGKERAVKDQTVAAAAAPAAVSAGPPAAAASSSSSAASAAPLFPASARPVAVLTSELMNDRKADDRALIASLISRGIPAEHVVWHAPSRAWNQYRAVVVKSPWGYFKRSAEWLRFLSELEAAHTPVANSIAVLRWNSNKSYLRSMQTKVESAAAAAAAGSNGALGAPPSKKLFDFIPTAWLTQRDLLDAASIESLVIARGWAGCGAVLKPTSSAGGFGTLRLPSVGNAEFARAVAEAARMDLQPEGADAPTWMLQPFQPQILTDGEYSFFFLLDPASAAGSASAGSGSGSAQQPLSSSSRSGSAQLRFVHGGQKRPKSGSFLVQPTNGGVLTAWVPTEEQIQAARAIIDATPFGTAASAAAKGEAGSSWSAVAGSASAAAAAGLPDLLYVRVDCIRSPDPSRRSGSLTGDLSEGPLLLMEVEAIEPDYYSHLSPDFESVYFESVKAFLDRAGAWTLNASSNTTATDATETVANGAEGPQLHHLSSATAAAAASGSSSSTPQSGGSHAPAPSAAAPREFDPLKVYVENLPIPISEAQLRDAFQQFGLITRILIGSDRVTKAQVGFAFVEFAQESQALAAIAAMHQRELNGRIIRCSLAKRKAAPNAQPSATASFTDPLSSRARGASAVRTPAAPGAGVSHLIEHFEEAIADETAEARRARLDAAAAVTHAAAATSVPALAAASAPAASAVPSASSGDDVAVPAAADSAAEPGADSEPAASAAASTGSGGGGKKSKKHNKKKAAGASAAE